jgi:hypothetical protein
MEHNKAHGFPAKFYHVFWEPIKKDLMVLFHNIHIGNLPMYNLNFVTKNKNKLALCSNTYLFVAYKSPMKTCMQILFGVTHWCQLWALFQPCE